MPVFWTTPRPGKHWARLVRWRSQELLEQFFQNLAACDTKKFLWWHGEYSCGPDQTAQKRGDAEARRQFFRSPITGSPDSPPRLREGVKKNRHGDWSDT